MAAREDSSGFHTFAVDPPYAAQTLARRIEKRMVEISAQMVAGTIKSWEDYQRTLGRIEGLREAFDLCIEAQRGDERERRALRDAS